MQRLPSLPHEIRNHCSRGVVAFCRRNHSLSPQRKLESDADLVAATITVGGPFFTAAARTLHWFISLGLKSGIDARRRGFPRVLPELAESLWCGRGSNPRHPPPSPIVFSKLTLFLRPNCNYPSSIFWTLKSKLTLRLRRNTSVRIFFGKNTSGLHIDRFMQRYLRFLIALKIL